MLCSDYKIKFKPLYYGLISKTSKFTQLKLVKKSSFTLWCKFNALKSSDYLGILDLNEPLICAIDMTQIYKIKKYISKNKL